MTPVERQVRFMIRAWPIPDRIERGDEIVGTTLDLVPDGATRLPLPLAVNLLAGGMRARFLPGDLQAQWGHGNDQTPPERSRDFGVASFYRG